MRDGEDFRRNIVKMAEASQAEKNGLFRFRETLDTTILGTLSTSVGLVVLLIELLGILGFRRVEWHDMVDDTAMPSFTFGIAAIIGEVLGLAGLALGRIRGGTISPLSLVGTIVCLIQMYLLFGQLLLLHLF
jgi:uncharacterized Tic20 family protein